MVGNPPEFDFETTSSPRVYQRDGVDTYLDPCRQQLVPADPEEEVRQCFLDYLVEEISVPMELLKSEVPVARFEKHKRGRADIVGFSRSEEGFKPLFVVECKAPNVTLVDDDLHQIQRYDDAIECRANILILTNGHQTIWFHHPSDDELKRLERPLSFTEMVEGADIQYRESPEPVERPELGDYSLAEPFEELGLLGVDTPEEHYDYLFNLIGLLYFSENDPNYDAEADRFHFVDSDIRTTRYGNPSGGRWSGYYRYFLLRNAKGDHQIVSLGVMGHISTDDHPRYGTQIGRSLLVVGIDDFEKSHLSLQHDLDNLVRRKQDSVQLYHDGRLTVGAQGAAKRSDVLEFVERQEPGLMSDGEIVLGAIPTDEQMTWRNSQDLVERIIRYGLVRDRYRDSVR